MGKTAGGRDIAGVKRRPPVQRAATFGQLEVERSHAEPADLQDLLIVAVNLAAQMASKVDDAAMAEMPAAVIMGLTDSSFVRIMLESQTEMETLQAALG